MFEDTSYVYCLWYVPYGNGDNFFAAMIHDEGADRILYRFESGAGQDKKYFVMERGGRTVQEFKRRFNRSVEEFSDAVSSAMEYVPVESDVQRALELVEQQPWAYEILPA